MKSLQQALLGALAASVFLAPTLAVAAPMTQNTDPAKGPVQVAGAWDWTKRTGKQAAIHTAVRTKLWEDKLLDNTNINVDVSKEDAVTLRGAVNTEAQKQRATDVARAVKDVASVDNQLTVTNSATNPKAPGKPSEVSEKFDNVQTTARIRADILKEGVTEGAHISVKTLNDVVILNGYVANWDQYNTAYRVASGTPGITKVINRLKIK